MNHAENNACPPPNWANIDRLLSSSYTARQLNKHRLLSQTGHSYHIEIPLIRRWILERTPDRFWILDFLPHSPTPHPHRRRVTPTAGQSSLNGQRLHQGEVG